MNRSIPLIAYEVFGKFSFYFFTLSLAISQIIITATYLRKSDIYLVALLDFIEDKIIGLQ